MRKHTIIRVLLVSLAVSTTLLVYSATRKSSNPDCKESIDSCCQPSQNGGKMIWEDLSRQFFSAI